MLEGIGRQIVNEITAWYDDEKRAKILQDQADIHFYAIHATHSGERMQWINELIKRYNAEQPSRLINGTNTSSSRASIQD